MKFFHIPNRTICLSKKILYQYFVVFSCPALDNVSSENILYVITYTKILRKYKPPLTR